MSDEKGRVERIAVRVDPDLKAELEKAAKAEGRSLSSWAERLFRREVEAIAQSVRSGRK